jgi:hypothetical protein
VITVVRRLWLTLLGFALVVVCLAAGAAVRSVAQAPPPHHLEIALPAAGEGFTDAPRHALLDTVRLAPGRGATGVMGVRNTSAGPAELALTMIAIGDDARCATGTACGADRRRMEQLVRFTIAMSRGQHGSYRPVWAGTSGQLARTVHLPGAVDAGAAHWLRLTARLPMNAGNDVQGQGFRFGLRVALDAGVLGTSTTVLGAHHRHGFRVAGLAVTGIRLGLLTMVAAALLLSGIVVTLMGRRRSNVAIAPI